MRSFGGERTRMKEATEWVSGGEICPGLKEQGAGIPPREKVRVSSLIEIAFEAAGVVEPKGLKRG
jgi:hypothetical protein